MFIRRYGSGAQACVCLHGWSGDSKSFELLASFLGTDVELHAVDLPGYGRSPAPAEWSLEAVAAEVARAIESLGLGPVMLAGNCIGALLGMRVAKAFPHLVSRLVLIDPLAYWPWYFRLFTISNFGNYAYFCAFANPIGRWLANASMRAKRTAQTHLTEGFATVRHDVNLRYLELMREIESPKEFAGLSQPVDLLYGSRTFGAVRESVATWKTILPQARAIELAGAGHLPLRETPDAVAAVLMEGAACLRRSPDMSASSLR